MGSNTITLPEIDLKKARMALIKLVMGMTVTEPGTEAAGKLIVDFLEVFSPSALSGMLLEIELLRETKAKFTAQVRAAYEAGLKQGQEDRTEPDDATKALLASLTAK